MSSRVSEAELMFPKTILRRMRVRGVLLALLALALVPLAILAIAQGVVRLQRDTETNSAQLTERALVTALAEGSVVQRSENLLQVLAMNERLRRGTVAECRSILQAMHEQFLSYSNFSLIDRNGVIRCTSSAKSENVKVFVKNKSWHAMEGGQDFTISEPLWGPISQSQIISAALRLNTPEGVFDGVLTASIDLQGLDRQLRQRHGKDDAYVTMLDSQGRPIASSQKLPWRQLDISGPRGETKLITDEAKRQWVYAVSSLYRDPDSGSGLYVAYASPRPTLSGPDRWFVVGYFTLPLLALLLASAAISLGADWSIVRWVKGLRTLAADYADGQYTARVDSLASAPIELRELAGSLHSMAGTIAERDTALTGALAHQMALTREIHHRVKNNLQIVVSVLSLQARAAGSEEARQALENARLRIAGLALTHRLLFESREQASVSSATLIGELCRQLRNNWADRLGVDVICNADDVPLDLDSAIPITMWIVEALANSLEHGYKAGDTGTVKLTLECNDGEVRLAVVEDGVGFDVSAISAGPGRRTLAAIARQLGGSLTLESQPGHTQLELYIPNARFGSDVNADLAADNVKKRNKANA